MENTLRETRISIRFPRDILAALRTLARQHERSFNGEVIWALREYVERQRPQGEREQQP
jgi:hypothetical protein